MGIKGAGEDLGNVVEDQDQDQDTDDDTLVVDDPEGELEEQSDDDSTDDSDPSDEGEGDASDDDADGEVVVSLGEEAATEEVDDKSAPQWVRELRVSNREKDRRIRELEKKLRTAAPAQPAAVVVGDKPTLESCDFDADKFETELEAWHTRKREVEQQQRTKEDAEKKDRERWDARLGAVTTAGSALKVKDYAEAAQVFEDTFSPVQQGIILGGPDDPKASALLRYALGKSPKKAKELAAIEDPVKFSFAVANLEKQLKVTPRKTAPAPDRVVRSSAPGAAAVDNQLERLRAEAAKTGDMSKVLKYKNEQRAKRK